MTGRDISDIMIFSFQGRAFTLALSALSIFPIPYSLFP